MIDDAVTVGFGLLVIPVGAGFWMTMARRPDFIPATEDEQDEFDFLDRRAGRRIKVSVGIVVCGLLFVASGLIDAEVYPRASLLLALCSIPIVFWAALMALGDWALTHRRASKQLRNVQSEREAMERAIQAYQERDRA